MTAQISGPGRPKAWISPWTTDWLTDREVRVVAPRSTLPVPSRYILAGLALVAALLSLRFVLIGAWPVLIFALLDIGGLAVAFHVFARGTVPEERISLVDSRLHIVRIDARGRREQMELPAFWTRLEASGRTELDCDLHLVVRQRRYPIAQCVSAAERRSLIPRIEALLARARQPSP